MSNELDTELRKFVAPEFLFGAGSRLMAGKYAANLGCRRILLVSDPGVTNAGWVSEMMTLLERHDLEYELFQDITPNPKEHEIMAGWEMFHSNRCDSILALGGGSVIDCAKGIGIIAGNGGDILSYVGVDTVGSPCPPLICVPTTAGAGADVSQFAIISDTTHRCKVAIISKAIVPDVSLIDPDVLQTLPSFLLACTGMDALTHAIEAYVSNAGSPITDVHALKAVELVAQNLRVLTRDSANKFARQQMCLACLEAGLAFSNASLGAVHAMAHSLGGYLDLPHGECNALLLEHVVNFNFDRVPEKYGELAQIIGVGEKSDLPRTTRDSIYSWLFSLREDIGITGALAARGVSCSELNALAKHAVVDPCIVTNPRKIRLEDIKLIYEEAM